MASVALEDRRGLAPGSNRPANHRSRSQTRWAPDFPAGSPSWRSRWSARPPAGGPRLETAQGQTPVSQAVGNAEGRGLTGPAAGLGGLAGDGAALHGGPGGDDKGLGFVRFAGGGGQAEAALGAPLGVGAGLACQARDGGLLQAQPRLPLEGLLHVEHVQALVCLGPGHLDGGTLTGVEHADLDEGAVDGPGHLTAEGVDLADDVAFGRAADGGVAGHESQRIEVHGDEQGAASNAGGG